MYRVDHRDKVFPLAGVPASSGGSPLPVVLANDQALLVAYYIESPAPAWNGTNPRAINPSVTEDAVAILDFGVARAHYFGPPIDEAFSGHPLASRGLSPYGAFEVRNSSWIRELVEINSVHPRHDPALFSSLRHFVLTFHDEVFECVARDFDATVVDGPLARAVAEVQQRLFR
jgi:hypothetical protein